MSSPMTPFPRRFLPLAAVALLSSCTLLPVHRSTAPVHFPQASPPQARGSFPSWPMPPDRAAAVMSTAGVQLRGGGAVGGGTTGAEKRSLYVPENDVEMVAKWKRMPRGSLDGLNNSPRKELAAYAIQKLFLELEDYVVPTSVALCVALDPARGDHLAPGAAVSGSRCVLGIASVWLENVTAPDKLFDDARFRAERGYARLMANFNLLTYLIAHHDGRRGNFLVSKDAKRPQVFSVDNGVSFGGFFYNWFVRNWSSIRVPALRKDSVDRLRVVERSDLDFLGVVAQLELDEAGVFQNVAAGRNLAPKKGVRIRGGSLQFGLTVSEIDAVHRRIRDLISEVDEGGLQVF